MKASATRCIASRWFIQASLDSKLEAQMSLVYTEGKRGLVHFTTQGQDRPAGIQDLLEGL